MNKRVKAILESGSCYGEEDDSNLFYHATPAVNVASILAKGIHPGCLNSNFDDHQKWCYDKVFLTAGYERAIHWQGVIAEMTGEDVSILEVRLPLMLWKRLRVDRVSEKEGDSFAFYIRNTVILPKYISVADTGRGTAGF